MLVARRHQLVWARRATIAGLVLSPLTLVPYLTSGTEMARARNALAFEALPVTAFEWSPAQAPADFLREAEAPTPAFVALAAELKLAELPDDWARAVAISQHLLTSAPQLKGGAVQLGLDETLRRITQDGDGYCADFVRVFTAIATAAGMPVRSWAFSFDGFGGHGHVLPEIWNRQRNVWQALDLFDNVYFVSADGLPLSALALRTWLTQRPDTPQVLPLAPDARPGYAIESKLWDYYRAGLNEWYLWWGNNPFSYEQAAPVRWLSPVSRSLAQLGAVALGVQPPPRAIATAANEAQRATMGWLRWHLLAVVFVVLACALAWVAVTWRLSRTPAPTGDLA